MIELLILAGVAAFLAYMLWQVLGTRTGYEGDSETWQNARVNSNQTAGTSDFDVIDGNAAQGDIADHIDPTSPAGQALIQMIAVEPDFSANDFVSGARAAYEMILTAFDRGDIDSVADFLAPDILSGFRQALDDRAEQGLTVTSEFLGVRETKLRDARFDQSDNMVDIVVYFSAELTTVIRNAEGEIIEGDPNAIRKQSDVWTFSRVAGTGNPNWLLVATGG